MIFNSISDLSRKSENLKKPTLWPYKPQQEKEAMFF